MNSNIHMPHNDVFFSTFWIYVIARYFGFCPFSIEKKCNKPKEYLVRVKPFDCCWFFVSILMNIAFMTIGIFKFTARMVTGFEYIEIILSQVTFMSENLIAIMCIVLDMANRRMLLKIITTLNDFDNEV